MEISIKACDKLIVDSYYSKKEIIENLKLNEKKYLLYTLELMKNF